jgi:hypothetical protein
LPTFDVQFSRDGSRYAAVLGDQAAIIGHLVLTPDQACELIGTEVTRSQLREALGGVEPTGCTRLR